MPTSDPTRVETYPMFPESLPERPVEQGRYEARFARTPEELQAIQRLRFEVFNLELGEGLEESYRTGLDQDRFDATCHHLMVVDRRDDAVIGTYRMQTSAMADCELGFYTADEFDMSRLPDEVVHDAIEVGRACVAKAYRNRMVLFLLWRGLAAYLERNRKRFLFGCCSLTSQDPVEGKRVMRFLESRGHVHPTWRVEPNPDWICYDDTVVAPPDDGQEVKLPKLFSLYLRTGAKVCGPPALDRHFKTIDYFVLLALDDLGDDTREMFFG